MTTRVELDRELRAQGYPILLTAAEAARVLRCSERTVWRLSSAGRLPGARRGMRTMFLRRDVASLMTRR